MKKQYLNGHKKFPSGLDKYKICDAFALKNQPILLKYAFIEGNEIDFSTRACTIEVDSVECFAFCLEHIELNKYRFLDNIVKYKAIGCLEYVLKNISLPYVHEVNLFAMVCKACWLDGLIYLYKYDCMGNSRPTLHFDLTKENTVFSFYVMSHNLIIFENQGIELFKKFIISIKNNLLEILKIAYIHSDYGILIRDYMYGEF